MGGRLGCDLSVSGRGGTCLGTSSEDSRTARRNAQSGEDPDCAHLARLRVSRIQNPTWERQVPPTPRSDQIQTESAESLCHSHTEVSGPIQGSDQGPHSEENTSAFGRIDRNDQPDHPRMGKLLLSLPCQKALPSVGRLDNPTAVVTSHQAVA